MKKFLYLLLCCLVIVVVFLILFNVNNTPAPVKPASVVSDQTVENELVAASQSPAVVPVVPPVKVTKATAPAVKRVVAKYHKFRQKNVAPAGKLPAYKLIGCGHTCRPFNSGPFLHENNYMSPMGYAHWQAYKLTGSWT